MRASTTRSNTLKRIPIAEVRLRAAKAAFRFQNRPVCKFDLGHRGLNKQRPTIFRNKRGRQLRRPLLGIYCTLGFFGVVGVVGVRSLQAPPWHLPVEL